MKSKTSLFNKTVLLKDITRFCPVWIIFSVVTIMPTMGNLSTNYLMTQENYLAAEMAWSTGGWAIGSFIYALVCAFFLFGDLFKGRLCNALHAFPLRRESWFATHALAGVLFFLVPTTVSAFISLPYMGQYWFIAPMWLLAATVMYLFFFALAILCVMLTGSRFAAGAVYLIINFLSALCYWLVDTYYAPLLPGLHIRDEAFFWFCPPAVLAGLELFSFEEIFTPKAGWTDGVYQYVFRGFTTDWMYIGIAFVLAVAFIALGLVLYRKRKLESAGDFLAFRKPQPVFLVIFSLAVGALFQTIFGLFDSNIVSMLIGLVIGCYAGQMLLRRTIKVFDKRSLIWCGALVGALALTLVLTSIDPLGLTRWTPKADQVTSITLSENYEYTPPENVEDSYYSFYQSVTVKDPTQIQRVISAHQRIISEKAYTPEDQAYMGYSEIYPIHMTYHMADGRDVVRRYYVNDISVWQELTPLFNSAEYVLGYTDFNAFFADVKAVYVDGNELYGEANLRSLLEAVWADCEAGTLSQSQGHLGSTDHWVEIEVEYNYISLNVYYSSKNTLNWIKDRNSTH